VEFIFQKNIQKDKCINLHTSKIDMDFDACNNYESKIESLKSTLHNFQEANNNELANIMTFSNELH